VKLSFILFRNFSGLKYDGFEMGILTNFNKNYDYNNSREHKLWEPLNKIETF